MRILFTYETCFYFDLRLLQHNFWEHPPLKSLNLDLKGIPLDLREPQHTPFLRTPWIPNPPNERNSEP